MNEKQTGKLLSDLDRIVISLDRMAAALAIEVSYKVKDEIFPSSEVGDTTIHVLQSAESLRQRALERLVHSYQQGG
ncbi:MAG: hypothetical protein ACYTDU_17385 [Planctomycetota bacterium]|jgi:hypothetical protein